MIERVRQLLNRHAASLENCQCANCRALDRTIECETCGYSGPAFTVPCACYDYSCSGGSSTGAGCFHGGLCCPVCDDGNIDPWELVRGVREASKPGPAVYVGIFLYPHCHSALLDWWRASVAVDLLPKLYAHHLTLKFRPSEAELAALPLGREVGMTITGFAHDSQAQAVTVEAELPSANEHPHITVATALGTKPVYANELLKTATMLKGARLFGTVRTFP